MIDVRDVERVRGMRPFLVAHRGGVIGADSPENSLRAIALAAEHGYAMVELDVMEAGDGEPILMHDGLGINCGLKERIHNLTSKEITGLRYRASDQHVIALEQAVHACASLGLGIMLDKLRNDCAEDGEMSAACLGRVASMIRDAGLGASTVAIFDTPILREHLSEVALFPVRKQDIARVAAGEAVALHGEFWFGWGADLRGDGVANLHANGAFTIVSINTFHYPKHAHDELARQDIERLLAAGVDGFQIDSVYEDCFEASSGEG